VKLHFKLSKAKETSPWLLLIHGLFGSADNLAGVRRYFEETYNIISIDLPDHGLSPWTEHFTFNATVDSIIALLNHLEVKQTAVVGHSLGGKIAMQLALTHPDRITHLVVADIAPVKYKHRHQEVFDGLKKVPLSTISGRKDAQLAMSEHVKEPGVQQFLLKSLYQTDEGAWQWHFNLDGLISSYSHIIDWPQSNHQFTGVTLFIKGGESDYINASHREAIAKYFPNAKAHIIEGTGHWLHAEKPDAFNAVIARTLKKPLE